ncbi:hypothetical protein J7K27_02420 [Candidatus Bathyarchaeota archaeon]|nr:hypothetical protein [Candidatus Bathyarchaeota archaeon]
MAWLIKKIRKLVLGETMVERKLKILTPPTTVEHLIEAEYSAVTTLWDVEVDAKPYHKVDSIVIRGCENIEEIYFGVGRVYCALKKPLKVYLAEDEYGFDKYVLDEEAVKWLKRQGLII